MLANSVPVSYALEQDENLAMIAEGIDDPPLGNELQKDENLEINKEDVDDPLADNGAQFAADGQCYKSEFIQRWFAGQIRNRVVARR